MMRGMNELAGFSTACCDFHKATTVGTAVPRWLHKHTLKFETM